jgi:hypothetical protein
MSLRETSRWREGIEHRFAVGTPVWVFLGQGQWIKARVQDLQTKTSAGVMPYAVKLPDGTHMCAPVDSDACIRQALDSECLWDAPKDSSDTPVLPLDGKGHIDAGQVIMASDRRDRLRRL